MKQTARSQAHGRRQRLLTLLADGQYQSGEHLARRLRISRGGVWKLIRSLRALGIEVESLPRHGYRLPRPVNLLERAAVMAEISAEVQMMIERLDVLLSTDSTNVYLAEAEDVSPGRLQACLAEVQQAGRGRRGRSWIAPFGCGLCMSISWRFQEAPPAFSALGLAVAVAAVGALERFGVLGVGVKWPNDLLWHERKLAGILIEMRGESAGPAHVVIGIGMNVGMPESMRVAVTAAAQALPISDLHDVFNGLPPTRNQLAGALIDELARMLLTFSQHGFAPFVDQWRKLDVLANAPVRVISGIDTVVGIARGVELDGTLLVDVAGQMRRFASGDVSLRRGEQVPLAPPSDAP
jgi:BirA family transcriptional regulator, biotin operon repressor / biotin---[acetyl-CoA-carboxylase] ligase